jgi:endonuclease YncB( thermonuclease family)
MVLGQGVKVQWTKRDEFGRVVGKVWIKPAQCAACKLTRDAGLAQLEAGMAWWDQPSRREQTLLDQGYYEYAEFDAKSRGLGLWSQSKPVPPWEWRKKNLSVM